MTQPPCSMFDAFGVRRHAQGQAATTWRWQGAKLGEEGMVVACGGGEQVQAKHVGAGRNPEGTGN